MKSINLHRVTGYNTTNMVLPDLCLSEVRLTSCCKNKREVGEKEAQWMQSTQYAAAATVLPV